MLAESGTAVSTPVGTDVVEEVVTTPTTAAGIIEAVVITPITAAGTAADADRTGFGASASA